MTPFETWFEKTYPGERNIRYAVGSEAWVLHNKAYSSALLAWDAGIAWAKEQDSMTNKQPLYTHDFKIGDIVVSKHNIYVRYVVVMTHEDGTIDVQRQDATIEFTQQNPNLFVIVPVNRDEQIAWAKDVETSARQQWENAMAALLIAVDDKEKEG